MGVTVNSLKTSLHFCSNQFGVFIWLSLEKTVMTSFKVEKFKFKVEIVVEIKSCATIACSDVQYLEGRDLPCPLLFRQMLLSD